MLFLDVEVGFLDIILRTIGAVLCNFVYSLISWVYQLFMTVASLNILSSDQLGPIYERITLILTIVMTFYITFVFVKYVVQPDGITEKEKGVGNVAMRLILVIIMIAFVPKIFDLAFELQSRIIKNQVISKVILGNVENDYADLGSDFAADVLGKFYYVDMESEACLADNDRCKEVKDQVDDNLNRLRLGEGLDMTPGLMKAANVTVNGEKQTVAFVKFDFLWAMVVGGVIGWILLLYCIDVGVRYAQMIFLQVISPIAIMGYVAPQKDGIFQKWLKQCITTYLDLFIRILIINFVVLIISVLGTNFDSLLSDNESVGTTIGLFTYIALIIGLLLFAQKAPKMLQELLPSSGAASIGYGLSGKDRFSAPWNTVKGTWNTGKRVVGGVAGGTAGLWKGIKNWKSLGEDKENASLWDKAGTTWKRAFSVMKATTSGVKEGAGKDGGIRKGLKGASESIEKDIDLVNAGGTAFDSEYHSTAAQEEVTKYKRQLSKYEETKKSKKTVGETVSEIKAIKLLEQLRTTAEASGNSALANELTGRIKTIEKASRVYAALEANAQAKIQDPNASDADRAKAKAKAAEAFKKLQENMTSAVIGTGVLNSNLDNAMQLQLNGGAALVSKIKNGDPLTTKEIDIISSLRQTATLTGNIQEIMKKDSNSRTTAEQKELNNFLNGLDLTAAETEAKQWANGYLEQGSYKWSTIQTSISEAMKTTKDIQDDMITIEDENGQTVTVTIKSLIEDPEKFAKYIGDIADYANDRIIKINSDPKYKTAQANAQASGKKGN